jgi:excisionase family DNA binding protein
MSKNTHYEDLPDLLQPQEVADYLGLNVRTVREYIAQGDIRAAKTGNRYRIRKEWILNYLDYASQLTSE